MLRSIMTIFFTSAVASAQVATFESLTFPGTQNYSNNSAFTSAGVSFNNFYLPPSPPFGDYWSGFSYSKAKDVVTPGVDSNGNVVNQYSAFYKPAELPNDPVIGAGAGGSTNFAVVNNFSQGDAILTLPANTRPTSIAITNTTYTAISMRDGDAYAKKFGGATGNDADSFKLTILGFDSANNPTGSVEFYLADYRFTNNAQDYIVSGWTTVNLATLSDATRSLQFTLVSSDIGPFGMNTPSYFALDNVAFAPIPEPAMLLAGFVMAAFRYRKRV